MNYQSYLNAFTNFESRLGQIKPQSFDLARVHRLLHALGDPQNKLKFVHVAGTKGKGSTCALIAYILRAAGYRVGLYTSPHFYRINERIRILKTNARDADQDFCGSIPDGELDKLVKELKPCIDSVRDGLTYFEVLTGLALCHFARKKTDIVVLETGLGGRLDATNAVETLVDGLTPVSLDHTALLGKSLSKIAIEKAAIIKNPRSKVVIGEQVPEVMKIIQQRCRVFGIKPLVVGRDISLEPVSSSLAGQIFNVDTPMENYKEIKTALAGEHQLQNAAIAVGVVESLRDSGFVIPQKAVRRGVKETRWPGRFELLQKNPTVIVDCAHNPASADVLVETFRQLLAGKKVILILGLSDDKDIRGICRTLAGLPALIILTKSKNPRAFDFKQHSDAIPLFPSNKVVVCPSIKEALTLARRHAGRQDVILATGSVFIAAEIRTLFKHVST